SLADLESGGGLLPARFFVSSGPAIPEQQQPRGPMKPTKKSSRRASALQSTLRVTLISLSAALLALPAAPARNQIQQKPSGGGIALQTAHRRAAVSVSSASSKRRTPRKSACIEISASHQRVSGREIAGFSARQMQTGQEENLTPPAGLKPIEEE